MAKKHYHTHGSAAYAPDHAPQKSPSRKPQTSTRTLSRRPVQLREADALPIESIVGFVCIGALAATLMSGYAQLTTSSDQVVQLRNELKSLESEKLLMSAQYEKYFDIQRIEETLGSEMMLPTNEQVVYIDLSQPDNVKIIGKEDQAEKSFFDTLKNIFS